MKVHAEEDVEVEELEDDVGEVDELDEHVAHEQVIAVEAHPVALYSRRQQTLSATTHTPTPPWYATVYDNDMVVAWREKKYAYIYVIVQLR